jgi:hypothetical protein
LLLGFQTIDLTPLGAPFTLLVSLSLCWIFDHPNRDRELAGGLLIIA